MQEQEEEEEEVSSHIAADAFACVRPSDIITKNKKHTNQYYNSAYEWILSAG